MLAPSVASSMDSCKQCSCHKPKDRLAVDHQRQSQFEFLNFVQSKIYKKRYIFILVKCGKGNNTFLAWHECTVNTKAPWTSSKYYEHLSTLH